MNLILTHRKVINYKPKHFALTKPSIECTCYCQKIYYLSIKIFFNSVDCSKIIPKFPSVLRTLFFIKASDVPLLIP